MVASRRILDYKARAPGRSSASATLGQRSFSLMTKLKTKRAAAKRFRFTARGKVVRQHAHHRHYLTNKPQKVKVETRKSTLVAAADVKMVKRMLPYGA
jgi:large subunit ribosomal protein L35